MNFTFAPATREAAKARIGLQGPAGSGKTKSALRIAEGLARGGSIGVIDTERGSALTYAPVPGKPELGGHEFGHMPMDTHDPRHLIQAIAAARAASINVLIVDSWSHFWNGRGGLLTIVEEAGRKPGAGGSFGGWREGNPIEQDMLDALLNYPGHVIATMRTKGDYVIEGKKVTKVGVKAVQREGAEYELGLILDMVEGTGTVTKTRYEPLEGLTIHHPGEDLAEIILEQLGQGVDPIEVLMTDITAETLTYDGALALHARAKSRGLLETGQLHPKTGEPTTIGALIAEYGSALRPQPVQPTPPPSGPAPSGIPAQPQQSTAPSGPALVSAPQMRMMHACFAKVGLGAKDQREERLRATGLIIGRQVETANGLTFDEAATLLDTLTQYGDFDNPADEFAAMVQGLEDQLARA
ncbi:AAA family ATPase [Streptomyces sp. AM 2-1-1]|uniref:AAA family ATPase n=1 Tax=Streptomyces sp. AM 2-1-1 TaxID=3028709 RepID=UPI0023BA0239|nr:AAA family ATPase [Streptomyces sp. AM 2-1-1]WEH40757.1 AAA family ATPase [Streptomyces sp. AM 2-1-1]